MFFRDFSRAPTTIWRNRSSCRFSSPACRGCFAAASGSGSAPIASPPRPPVSSRFRFHERTIDFEQLEVQMGDKTMSLTLMEASLLRYLVEHEGRPVSRKTILEKVWGVREDTDTRAIDNFIVRLRRYLEDEPSSPRHLQTVRGVGYRFVADP